MSKKDTGTAVGRKKSTDGHADTFKGPLPSGTDHTSPMMKFRAELAMVADYVAVRPHLARIAVGVDASADGARELRTAYVLDAANRLAGEASSGMKLWIPPLDVFFGVCATLRESRGVVIDFDAAMRRRAEEHASKRARRTTDHHVDLAWSIVTSPITPRSA